MRPSYQTRVPRQKGCAIDKNLNITRDSYDLICAVLNAHRASLKDKSSIPILTPFELSNASDNTQARYLCKAKEVLLGWDSSGLVPQSALECFSRHYPKVWPKIQIVRNAMLESIDASEEYVDVPEISDEYNEELTRAEKLLSNISSDVLNVNTDQWQDATNYEDVSGDRTVDQLCQETLEFLLSTNRKRIKLSFKRILQHWSVDCNISHRSMTKLLKLLKKHKPRLGRAQYKELPYTGRTLVKLDVKASKEAVPMLVIKSSNGRETMGTYLHYGVLGGILGTSPGL